jgi:murein tripeptide amidase MpaA
LQISNPDGEGNQRGVVITARIHPGESNSSFAVKGIIDFLICQHSSDANLLR